MVLEIRGFTSTKQDALRHHQGREDPIGCIGLKVGLFSFVQIC